MMSEPPHENVSNALQVLLVHARDADLEMVISRLRDTSSQLAEAKRRFPNLYNLLFNPRLEERPVT